MAHNAKYVIIQDTSEVDLQASVNLEMFLRVVRDLQLVKSTLYTRLCVRRGAIARVPRNNTAALT